MFTGVSRIFVPGIFAASCIDTPSLGRSVSTSVFGLTPTDPSWAKPRCGTGRSVIAISVTVRARRLPVRR